MVEIECTFLVLLWDKSVGFGRRLELNFNSSFYVARVCCLVEEVPHLNPMQVFLEVF
jgi:hypothetical protein